MYIEFAIDIAGVGLDGVQSEEEPGCDVLIGRALGDEPEDFEFALA